LRNHGDRDELQPVDEPVTDRSAEGRRDDGKGDQQRDGRQREPAPCGDPAEPTGAQQTDGEASLAAGGSGQELAQADKIGEGLLVEPAAPFDKLATEIAEVRDGASEGRQAELKKHGKNVERRSSRASRRRDVCLHDDFEWLERVTVWDFKSAWLRLPRHDAAITGRSSKGRPARPSSFVTVFCVAYSVVTKHQRASAT